MRRLALVLLICVFGFSVIAGCTLFRPTGTLKISLTDAPADDHYLEVNVTIEEVRISKSLDETTEEWIVLNDAKQTLNLLELSGGKLEELGVKNLEPGTYNQIRFVVDSGNVLVEGSTDPFPLTINSGTVKLVGAFTIQAGITTELVVDFNAAKSVFRNGAGDYRMTPVTRVINKATTGAISGTVTLNNPPATAPLITVSTTDGGGNEISTICAEDGSFLLGFLPAGTYDLSVEALDYTTYTIDNVEVTVGNTATVDPVTLTPVTP